MIKGNFLKQYENIKETYNKIINKIINKEILYKNTDLANKKLRNHYFFEGLILAAIFSIVSFLFITGFNHSDSSNKIFKIFSGLILVFFSGAGVFFILDSFVDPDKHSTPSTVSSSQKNKMINDLNTIDHPFIDFIKENIDFQKYYELNSYLSFEKDITNFHNLFLYYLKKLTPKDFLHNEKDIFNILKNDKLLRINKPLLEILSNFYTSLYQNKNLTEGDIENRINYFKNFKLKRTYQLDLDYFEEKLYNQIKTVKAEDHIFKESMPENKEKHILF